MKPIKQVMGQLIPADERSELVPKPINGILKQLKWRKKTMCYCSVQLFAGQGLFSKYTSFCLGFALKLIIILAIQLRMLFKYKQLSNRWSRTWKTSVLILTRLLNYIKQLDAKNIEFSVIKITLNKLPYHQQSTKTEMASKSSFFCRT